MANSRFVHKLSQCLTWVNNFDRIGVTFDRYRKTPSSREPERNKHNGNRPIRRVIESRSILYQTNGLTLLYTIGENKTSLAELLSKEQRSLYVACISCLMMSTPVTRSVSCSSAKGVPKKFFHQHLVHTVKVPHWTSTLPSDVRYGSKQAIPIHVVPK